MEKPFDDLHVGIESQLLNSPEHIPDSPAVSAARKDGDTVDGLIALGKALSRQLRFRQAILAYTQALKMAPDITELDMIFKRLYEDNISGKLTDERFHKLSTDYEAEQAGLQAQAAMLREEIEEAESKSANVDRFLSVVRQYTDIPELTPRILHEFVEKIVIHAATDPHSKINRRQEVDIYYKGIGILAMSKVFDSRQK